MLILEEIEGITILKSLKHQSIIKEDCFLSNYWINYLSQILSYKNQQVL